MKVTAAALFLTIGMAVSPLFAADAGLDPALLLKPPTDSWPTFNGDYSGRRYSTLAQINQDNVHQLTLSWVLPTEGHAIKSMPLLVNGILLFHDAG